MNIYQTKGEKLAGSDFGEVHKKARRIYDGICIKSKRKPYVRSAYFRREKIFLDYFWDHLFSKKNLRDRLRRVKLYEVAIELIKNSNFKPELRQNPNVKKEFFYRFRGKTKGGEIFIVQIKENKNTHQKYFISVFPE